MTRKRAAVDDDHPRLRAVEAFPVEQEGRRFLALRDPAGYAPSAVMLPVELLSILRSFDGEHTIVDIQAEIMREHGDLVPRRVIEDVIAALDEQGFMDSRRFAERRAAIDGEFLASPSRAAAHAGGAYPGDRDELRRTMDGYFSAPTGPGPIAHAGGASDGAAVDGIIAPHIDFHRGGPAYAWAYRDLAERCAADLFVIFGTCHAGMRHPFALTRKDYDTPFGAARVDGDFVDAVSARSGVDCFASELAHRTEHSLEFQAVFLQYLYAGRREFTIVPVLTSFAHEALARRRSPADDAAIVRCLDAIVETAARSGRRVAFIAGADLAHVGPRFGDRDPVSPAALARIDREDRTMLASVEAGDARAFFASVAADGDRRRICGLSPIYALLHALPGRRGTIKHYGQWPDPEAVVSYASVVF